MEPFQCVLQFRREWGFEEPFILTYRMDETELIGMEEVSVLEEFLAPAAIDSISDHGVAQPGQVYTYLMCAAGVRVEFKKGVLLKALYGVISCAGIPAFCQSGHSLSIPGVTSNGNLDNAIRRLDPAVHQPQVDLLHFTVSELLLEGFERCLFLGHNHRSRGLLVQSVDNACPVPSSHFGDRTMMGQ